MMMVPILIFALTLGALADASAKDGALVATIKSFSLCSEALAATNDETVSVDYVDAKGVSKGEVSATVLQPDNGNMGDGWYAVTQDVTYEAGLIVNGNANLILCDGKTLSGTDGIWVQENASLTIWAQSIGDEMGKLVSKSSLRGFKGSVGKAAIGAIKGEVAGNIVINGGDIDAESSNNGAAGIGGGMGPDGGFKRIEINGGKVTAVGTAAGIGIGDVNEKPGTIVINGGTVDATGSGKYPGIGHSLRYGVPGEVTITGGKVTSQGGLAGIGSSKVTISGDEAAGDYVHAYAGGEAAGIVGGTITINGSEVTAKGSGGGAGIGGEKNKNGNGITINGGNVTAIGGSVLDGYSVEGGAGIGGGVSGECQDVTINGGKVQASGTEGGAGIGGGSDGDLIGTVTITGGVVDAFGSDGGAGIGGGNEGNAGKGTVNITGGKVAAFGSSKGAGIGGGNEGGFEVGGEGATVNISGAADVIAWSGGGRSSAIGHGDNDREYGLLTIGDEMMVRAGWNATEGEASTPFSAAERVNACQYRWFAHITPCDHAAGKFSITEKQHSWQCTYCEKNSGWQDHETNDENCCTVCMYQGELYTVTFDANGGRGTMAAMNAIPGKGIPMPGCGFTAPEGKTFGHWETEDGKTYNKGDTLDPVADTVVKAVYDTKGYGLWVNGEQVSSANKDQLLGGMATYEDDGTSGTLTLKRGALVTGEHLYAGIWSDVEELTIVAEGDCAIDAESRYGIQACGGLTIKGGPLTVKGENHAIYAEGALSIENADVTASGAKGSGMATATDAAMSIKQSVVTVSGGGSIPGIDANGKLDIIGEDSVVSVTASRSAAIRAMGGITVDQNLVVAEPAGGDVESSGTYIQDANGDTSVHHVVIRKAEAYPVWVGDAQVNAKNAIDVLGDGSVRYNSATQTLVFEGSPALGDTAVAALVRTDGQGLTIEAPEGGLTLADAKAATGVYVGGDLTFDGDVSVVAKATAIHADGEILATGSLRAEARGAGPTDSLVYAGSDIDVGGDLTGLSLGGMGLFCAHGSVSVDGGARLAASAGTLLKAAEGDVTVRGDVSTEVRIGGAASVRNDTATGFDAGGTIWVAGGTWDVWTASDGTAMRAKSIDIPETHEIKTPAGGEVRAVGSYEAVVTDGEGNAARHAVVMVKAQTPETFTVTFEADGDPETVEVLSGMTVERPEDPTREGYEFLSWATKEDYVEYDFDTPVTENLHLVALWYRTEETEPEEVTWTYDEADADKRTLAVDADETAYQWYSVGGGKHSAIHGATSSTYTLPRSTEAGVYTLHCQGMKVEDGVATLRSHVFRVTVTKADPVVVVEGNSGLTYTGNNLRLLRTGATTGGTLLYSTDNENWSKAIPTARHAGTYDIHYKVEGDENYSDTAGGTVAVKIAKRTLTIYPIDKTKTYGEADPVFTFTQTGLLSGDGLVGELAREDAGEDVGKYSISQGTLEVAGENGDDYNVVVNPGALLTVARRPITVSGITAENKVYDGGVSATLVTDGATLDGRIEADKDRLGIGATGEFEDKNAGEGKKVTIYDLLLTGEAADNYELAESGQQAEVTASIWPLEAQIAWSPNPASFTFDGTEKCPVAEVANKGDDDVSVVVDGAATDAGEHVATATELAGADAGNYALPAGGSQLSCTFAIAKGTWERTGVETTCAVGGEGSLDLSEYLAPGGSFGGVSVDDPEGILGGAPQLSEDKLRYKIASDADAGASANISIPVRGATHHADYVLVVTITATEAPVEDTEWNDPRYAWSFDRSTVTAVRTGKDDPSLVETETVEATMEVTKEPKCEEEGERTYTATFRNAAFVSQTKTEPIEATGHDWGEWEETRPATEMDEGEGQRVCANNPEHVQTRAIPIPHEHTDFVVTEAVAPTCAREGNVGYRTCGVCHQRFGGEDANEPLDDEDIVILATGNHTFGEPTYEWDESGLVVVARRVCDVCGKEELEEAVATATVTKEPAVGVAGERTYTATFTHPGFEAQSRTEEIAPLVGKTLTFDANGGKGSMEPAVVAAGTRLPLPKCTFEAPQEGMVFDAWLIDGVRYASDTKVTVEQDTVARAVWKVARPVFKTQSLTLSGLIGVNFFMELPPLEGVDYASSYMEFEVNGKKTIAEYDPTNMSTVGNYYGFACYVSSVQMAEPITAVFHYGDGLTVTNEGSSVDEYVGKIDAHVAAGNENGISEEAVALAHALADYGHYAQPYLAHANGWEYGVKYAMMSRHYANSYDVDGIAARASAFAATKTIDGDDITGVSMALDLKSATTLEYFVKVKPGTQVRCEGGGLEAEKVNDKTWRVRVEGIAAHRLGDTVAVSGTAGGSHFEVSASPLSYVAVALPREDVDDEAKDALCAFYSYYEAAMAYRKV